MFLLLLSLGKGKRQGREELREEKEEEGQVRRLIVVFQCIDGALLQRVSSA
jgi:hypothetical protein